MGVIYGNMRVRNNSLGGYMIGDPQIHIRIKEYYYNWVSFGIMRIRRG